MLVLDADMYTLLNASRAYVYAVAKSCDQGKVTRQDAAAAILTYDVTNEKTFDSLNYWIDELRNKIDQDKIVLCLAGNKCDREITEKKVQFSQAKSMADTNKMIFFETSAKGDIGIKDLFYSLAKKIYEKKTSNPIS